MEREEDTNNLPNSALVRRAEEFTQQSGQANGKPRKIAGINYLPGYHVVLTYRYAMALLKENAQLSNIS